MHILLVAQDPDEVSVLIAALRRTDAIVMETDTVYGAQKAWERTPGDLIIVTDLIGQPELVLKDLRRFSLSPIMMVTDGLSEDRHIRLLEYGANIVLGRPYSVRLLISYARVLLRCSKPVKPVPVGMLPITMVGPFTITPETRSVRVGSEQEQILSHLEFALLEFLLANRGQILTAEVIADRVWSNVGAVGDTQLVRGLIWRLRRKIETDPEHPQYISTELGGGYRWMEPKTYSPYI